MAGVLIFLAVVIPIMGLIWIGYYLSKKADIIQKMEEAEATMMSVRAAEDKSAVVLSDAASIASAAVDRLERTWKESRDGILGSALNPVNEGKGQASILPINLYPPGNVVEVFTRLQDLSRTEAEDVQYLVERANAQLAIVRATIQKPFARIVARGMQVDAERFPFISAGRHPALERKPAAEEDEFISLKRPDEKEQDLTS